MAADTSAPVLTGPRLILAGFVLALTNFMVVLDTTIANVSVPHISGGLGVSLSGRGQGARFGHGGVNEGYRSEMVGLVNSGQGVVVMTNGEGGSQLIREIVSAISAEYGWPAVGGRVSDDSDAALESDDDAALALVESPAP